MTDNSIDDEEAFIEAFDNRERKRIESAMNTGVHPAMKAEQERVRDLLARDRADRERERARKEAVERVAQGDIASSADATIEPTPEWERQGDAKTYIPRQDDGSVRVVKTRRRILTPIAVRLHNNGKLTDEQFIVCLWYADQHERSGLKGRFKTSSFEGMPGSPSGGGMGQAPMAKHPGEAEARRNFREVRHGVDERTLRLFDGIVIHNLPIRGAARFARIGNDGVTRKFAEACEVIIARCEVIGIDLDDFGRRHA